MVIPSFCRRPSGTGEVLLGYPERHPVTGIRPDQRLQPLPSCPGFLWAGPHGLAVDAVNQHIGPSGVRSALDACNLLVTLAPGSCRLLSHLAVVGSTGRHALPVGQAGRSVTVSGWSKMVGSA